MCSGKTGKQKTKRKKGKTMKDLMAKYEALKNEKAKHEEEIAKIKEKLALIEKIFMENLDTNMQDGMLLGGYKIQVKHKRVFSATDWNQVYAYILNAKDFSVLQARLSSTRLKELEADGVSVGEIGVKAVDLRELSITKATRG